MSGERPNTLPEPPRPTQQAEYRWDLSAASVYACDVANSTAGADDVVLNLGVMQRGDDTPGELSVRMIRRFSLRPLTARHLRDMLRNVIADIDADQPRRR